MQNVEDSSETMLNNGWRNYRVTIEGKFKCSSSVMNALDITLKLLLLVGLISIIVITIYQYDYFIELLL